MAGCHVGHDCMVGNDVTLSNGVQLAGHVQIGDGVIMGGLSAVQQFGTSRPIRLHQRRSAASSRTSFRTATAIGCMRRLCGLNLVGLRRRKRSASEYSALRAAYRLIFRIRQTARFTRTRERAGERMARTSRKCRKLSASFSPMQSGRSVRRAGAARADEEE